MKKNVLKHKQGFINRNKIDVNYKNNHIIFSSKYLKNETH